MNRPSPPSTRLLWWRWSLRDLRKRWVSVVAIAVVIAIGTGVYAGLGSSGNWRRMSNDASFAALRMHDLQVSLSPGTTTDEGVLAALVAGLPSATDGTIEAVQERLILATQVDASIGEEAVLVPGRLVGSDTGVDAPVNALHIERGDRPQATDGATATLVLEQKFARHYDLPTEGDAVLAGGTEVRYVGHGVGPEYFLVTGAREAGFFAEANFAVLFAELVVVQRISGQEGKVNDVVIRLSTDADRAAVQAELDAAIAEVGGISATVTTRDDNTNYRLLYDDIEGDQKVWNALTLLILGAAAIAAFNLIGRIVDSQRREIGVQMALGVPPRHIVRRPILVGAQIALLGAVLGVGVGLLVGAAMRSLLVDFLPLPVWRTPFQFRTYAGAAAIGFVLPFVASILPVRRAVRIEPVNAIRTGHLAVRAGRRGSAPTSSDRTSARRRKVNALRRLPWRNAMRAPRRTLLTALGVGAAIAALVAVFGMIDSFFTTINRGETELLRSAPDRITVQLDGFEQTDGALLASIAALPEVAVVDPQLTLPVTLLAQPGATEPSEDDVDAFLTVIDMATAAWTPSIQRPADTGGRPGIVLSSKAADDLGLRPGDAITIRHPARTGLLSYSLITTEFGVAGVHPSPLRPLAYADMQVQDTFGLVGIVNSLDVLPAPGVTDDQLRRALFEQPGIASAQPVAAFTGLFEDALEQFLSFLVIAAVAVLILALLIAFNSTSIAVDERTRENATLFAFGLPVRSVVGLIAKESVLIGAASTVVGLALGALLTRWMIGTILADTVPDFGFDITLSATTVLVALLVGILAVALTPLFLIRRLRRMSIPDALRVME